MPCPCAHRCYHYILTSQVNLRYHIPMFKNIRDSFHNLLSPAFKWLQVEISSLCNGRCIYCPHTIYKDYWQGSLMSLETFAKLSPSLKRTKLVYLQGWGEPFLNPDIFKMIKIAKEHGCKVGTTTNGNLINERTLEKAIYSGLDIITFSLAGGEKTNNELRQGTDINHIKTQLSYLGRLPKRPEIHIADMMTRANLDDTIHILEYLNDLPIDNLVISTLDFIACKAIADEQLFPATTEEYDSLLAMLKRIQADGNKRGIAVNYYLGSPDQHYPTCTEMPQYTCFVSSDGSVSPCVFTNLPVDETEYLSNDNLSRYGRLVFGNINDEPLAAIWRKPAYRRFRDQFENGSFYAACETCRKIHMMAQ